MQNVQEGPHQRQAHEDGKKKVKFKIDNKLKGAYGETDMDTHVVKINKKLHKRDKEPIGSTMQHELLHLKHPKAHERTIRKMEKKTYRRMSSQRKKQLLDKLR